ncbi:inverse autotransporter beta domain-containing protein [Aeromonas veronii]
MCKGKKGKSVAEQFSAKWTGSGSQVGSNAMRVKHGLVWLNIVLQLSYPLALAFTPAVRAAVNSSNQDAVVNTAQQLSDLGSSASSAANPFETEAFEKAMATVAVESGQLLSNSNVGDQAKSRAISMGESAVNGAINSWMGQFGTAAVSLNSTDKGSFDFLLSVLEGKDYLFYTQLGARADEERTFFNAGLGARFFQPEVMFGVNSFYDYDLTGNNRRLGLGAELLHDYLKLAANG